MTANELEQIKRIVVEPVVQTLRAELKPLHRLEARVSKLERFKVRLLTVWSIVTAIVAVGGDALVRKLGSK